MIDASLEPVGNMFAFCPVEGDVVGGEFSVITGMTIVSDSPPGGMRLVAIVHPDGDEPLASFTIRHADLLHSLQDRSC